MTKRSEHTPKPLNKKYSQAMIQFICDHIEDGILISEQCRKYKDVVPDEKTIHRWKKKYPEFKKEVDEAYRTYCYRIIDEIELLSKELLQLDALFDRIKDQVDSDEITAKEGAFAIKIQLAKNRDHRDSVRIRLDTLKFIIAKLAPKLVPDLRDQPQAVAAAPVINIIRYDNPEHKLIETK